MDASSSKETKLWHCSKCGAQMVVGPTQWECPKCDRTSKQQCKWERTEVWPVMRYECHGQLGTIAGDDFKFCPFCGRSFLQPVETTASLTASSLDALIAEADKYILPVDVKIGAATFRKGVKVGTMLRGLKTHAERQTATAYSSEDRDRRIIERHMRWRETALGFLRQVIDGRGSEDEWPALAEFVEQSTTRMVLAEGSPEEPARELSPSEATSFAKTLARSPRRVEPPVQRCVCGEWLIPKGFVRAEVGTTVHRLNGPCHQKEPADERGYNEGPVRNPPL